VRDVKTRKNTAKPLKKITPNTNDADEYQHDDVQVHRTTQTSGRGTNKSLGQEQRHEQTVRQESKRHQQHHNATKISSKN
jgi:hypothetical protein